MIALLIFWKKKDRCSSLVKPIHEQYATTTTTSFSRSVQHRSDNGLCIRVNCSHTCMHLASGKRVARFLLLFQLRASRFCSQILYLLIFFRFRRVLSCIAPRRIVVCAPWEQARSSQCLWRLNEKVWFCERSVGTLLSCCKTNLFVFFSKTALL